MRRFFVIILVSVGFLGCASSQAKLGQALPLSVQKADKYQIIVEKERIKLIKENIRFGGDVYFITQDDVIVKKFEGASLEEALRFFNALSYEREKEKG